MEKKVYKFEAVIEPVPDKGGAFVRVPFDIREEFGKGRVKVLAEFDGVPYKGSIVNMGVKMMTEAFVILSVCERIYKNKWASIPEIPFPLLLQKICKKKNLRCGYFRSGGFYICDIL